MKLLTSINEMSAGDGFLIVLLYGLQAFGALALIVAVLVVMDKVYKKKHPQDNLEENTDIINQEKEGDNK